MSDSGITNYDRAIVALRNSGWRKLSPWIVEHSDGTRVGFHTPEPSVLSVWCEPHSPDKFIHESLLLGADAPVEELLRAVYDLAWEALGMHVCPLSEWVGGP